MIYYVFNEAQRITELIKNGDLANYYIYGAHHLKESGQAEIIDYKQSKQIKNSTVIINVPKYAPEFKARGNRVILINLNSNHILKRNPGFLMKWALTQIYKSCDVIMCLSNIQLEELKKFGIDKKKCVVNPLYVDMVDINLAKARLFGTYSPFYLSSGFDVGRTFSNFYKIDTRIPIVTLGRHAAIPYIQYCNYLVKCSGMVLEVHNSGMSSDLSSSTTVFEALCAHKPVFINPQPWLKDFPSKNIYVYTSSQELEGLLNSHKEWIPETADFTFGQFLNKLKKVLKIKS